MTIPETITAEPGSLASLIEVQVSGHGRDAATIELPIAALRLLVFSREAGPYLNAIHSFSGVRPNLRPQRCSAT